MVELSSFAMMFGYGFFQRAFVAGLCAAILCSVLGVFIVLRRASLIGEGVSHLSFGGIALGIYLSIYPLYTALVLALFGTLAISALHRKRIVYSETAIGLVFSFGLAIGVVLASLSGGFTVDLFSYLFGSILTVYEDDLYFIIGLTAIVLGFVFLFYKEMLHLAFDEQGARLSGVPVVAFEVVFNLLVALCVVVSIKIVGSLLVSSLLIIPAASSLQLSRSFKGTIAGSVALGIFSVVLGLVASFVFDIATGGAIVLVSIVTFVVCVGISKGWKALSSDEIAKPEEPCREEKVAEKAEEQND